MVSSFPLATSAVVWIAELTFGLNSVMPLTIERVVRHAKRPRTDYSPVAPHR